MARIYISSTYSDLQEHREKVYRVLRQLGHDVVAMEDYVAADQRPLDRCLADVDASDLYIGILAHRYGYIPEQDNPDGHSITELEYRRAEASGIPRLVFLLDENAPWPIGQTDGWTGEGDRGNRIRALRAELSRDRLASFFSTADELAQKVSVAASQQLQELAPGLHQPKIFLCYRREDTQGFARGIYESLSAKYGPEQVFRDIDSTPAGVRYSTWIESRVRQCNVLMVLIGHAWLSAEDHAGKRRLDLPRDWVRQEIEAALSHNIPIIPVRIQGTPMPSEDELPASIADLASFQSAEVADSRWNYDMGLLIQAVDNLTAPD